MYLAWFLFSALALGASIAQRDTTAWDAKGSGLCHDHKKAQSILDSYKHSVSSNGPFSYTGNYKIGCWAFNGGISACLVHGKCATSVQSICLVTRDMKPDFKYDSGLVVAKAQELISHGIKACGSIAVENDAKIGGGEGNGYLSFRYTEETQCLDNNHLWDHYTECAFNQQA